MNHHHHQHSYFSGSGSISSTGSVSSASAAFGNNNNNNNNNNSQQGAPLFLSQQQQQQQLALQNAHLQVLQQQQQQQQQQAAVNGNLFGVGGGMATGNTIGLLNMPQQQAQQMQGQYLQQQQQQLQPQQPQQQIVGMPSTAAFQGLPFLPPPPQFNGSPGVGPFNGGAVLANPGLQFQPQLPSNGSVQLNNSWPASSIPTPNPGNLKLAQVPQSISFQGALNQDAGTLAADAMPPTNKAGQVAQPGKRDRSNKSQGDSTNTKPKAKRRETTSTTTSTLGPSTTFPPTAATAATSNSITATTDLPPLPPTASVTANNAAGGSAALANQDAGTLAADAMPPTNKAGRVAQPGKRDRSNKSQGDSTNTKPKPKRRKTTSTTTSTLAASATFPPAAATAATSNNITATTDLPPLPPTASVTANNAAGGSAAFSSAGVLSATAINNVAGESTADQVEHMEEFDIGDTCGLYGSDIETHKRCRDAAIACGFKPHDLSAIMDGFHSSNLPSVLETMELIEKDHGLSQIGVVVDFAFLEAKKFMARDLADLRSKYTIGEFITQSNNAIYEAKLSGSMDYDQDNLVIKEVEMESIDTVLSRGDNDIQRWEGLKQFLRETATILREPVFWQILCQYECPFITPLFDSYLVRGSEDLGKGSQIPAAGGGLGQSKLYENQKVDRAYLVLKKCQKSLYELMKDLQRNGKKFSAFEAAHIMLQIMLALALAHHYGVMHRDVKLANILMDLQKAIQGHELWTARLTDFGESRQCANATIVENTRYVGTEGWDAPEMMDTAENLRRAAYYSNVADAFPLGLILAALYGSQLNTLNTPNTIEQFLQQRDKLIEELGKDPEWKWAQELLTKFLDRDPLTRSSVTDALKSETIRNLAFNDLVKTGDSTIMKEYDKAIARINRAAEAKWSSFQSDWIPQAREIRKAVVAVGGPLNALFEGDKEKFTEDRLKREINLREDKHAAVLLTVYCFVWAFKHGKEDDIEAESLAQAIEIFRSRTLAVEITAQINVHRYFRENKGMRAWWRESGQRVGQSASSPSGVGLKTALGILGDVEKNTRALESRLRLPLFGGDNNQRISPADANEITRLPRTDAELTLQQFQGIVLKAFSVGIKIDCKHELQHKIVIPVADALARFVWSAYISGKYKDGKYKDGEYKESQTLK